MKRSSLSIVVLLFALISAACPSPNEGDRSAPVQLLITLDATTTRIEDVRHLTMLGDLDGDGTVEFATTPSGDNNTLNIHFDLKQSPLTINAPASKLKAHQVISRDVNNDGQLDLIISSPRHLFEADIGAGLFDTDGAIYVFHGPLPKTGALDSTMADTVLRLNNMDPRFIEVADVTGDAQLDLILSNTATTKIYDNAFDGRTLLKKPSTEIDAFSGSFGGKVVIGDFNGDSKNDVALGMPASGLDDAPTGGVFFFFGPIAEGARDGVKDADSAWLDTKDNQGVGSQLISLGDLDGDGKTDLAISAREALAPTAQMQHAGRVFIVSGAPLMPTAILGNARVMYEGTLVGDLIGGQLAVGDANGDGKLDLMISNSRNTRRDLLGQPVAPRPIYVMHGPLDTSRPVKDANFTLWEAQSNDYVDAGGFAFADVTGDGNADWCILAPGRNNDSGSTGALFIMTDQ